MANLVLNGKSIDSIDDIAENFVEEDVLREFRSGSLSSWLEEYGYEEELERVRSIKPTASSISERLSEEELYERFKELKSKDENDWFKRFSLIADNLETFAVDLQKLSAEISLEKVFGDYTLKRMTDNECIN